MNVRELIRRMHAGAAVVPTPSDGTPDAFVIPGITGAEPSTSYTSGAVQLMGMDAPGAFSFPGGALIVNGVDRGSSGAVPANASIRAKALSSASYDTTISRDVTIGGTVSAFSIATKVAPTPTPTPSSLEPFYLDYRIWAVEGSATGTTVSTLTAPEPGASYAVVADSSDGGFTMSGNNLAVADGSKLVLADMSEHLVTIRKTLGSDTLDRDFWIFIVPTAPTVVFIDPRGTDGAGTAGTGASMNNPKLSMNGIAIASITAYSLARTGGAINPFAEHATYSAPADLTALMTTAKKTDIIFTSHDRYGEKLPPETRVSASHKYTGTRYTAANVGASPITFPSSAGVIVGVDMPSATMSGGAANGAIYNRHRWWFKVGGHATYPARIAPTAVDGVYSRTTSPQEVFVWHPLLDGLRSPTLVTNYKKVNEVVTGNNATDSTNPADWYDPSAEISIYWTGDPTTSRINFRCPNDMFAAADALAAMVGSTIAYRGGPNLTKYVKTLVYDPVHRVAQTEWGYNTGDPTLGQPALTSESCYWCLYNHPLGIVSPFQTGWIGERMVASVDPALADVATDEIFICARPSVQVSVGDTRMRWDRNMTLTVADLSELSMTPLRQAWTRAAGIGVYNADAVTGSVGFRGPKMLICDQARAGDAYDLIGNGSSNVAGAITDAKVGGVMMDTPGNARSIVVSGSKDVYVEGPSFINNNGSGTRFGGDGPGPSVIAGVIVVPRIDIHENGFNISYENQTDVITRDFWCGGSPGGPGVTQSGTNPSPDGRRRLVNGLLSGLILPSGVEAQFSLRIDSGLTNGLLDRVITLAGTTKFGKDNVRNSGNDGLIVQRCILDRPFEGSTGGANGVTFNRCIFFGNNAASPWSGTAFSTYLATGKGATVTNCLDLPAWPGYMTADIWKFLTATDAYLAGGPEEYESYSLWAPQFGFTLPAYGDAFEITRPYLAIERLYEGLPANMMVASFANPNPLCALSLPAGQGDNNKFLASLYYGHGLRTAVKLPYQDSFTIVLRVTNTVSGETHDFSYTVPCIRTSLT